MNNEELFDILQIFEGGDKVVTLPNDPGGTTKWGISQRAYPTLDIPNLTKEQAMAICTTDYILPSGANNVVPELQYVVFDTAFNCGVGIAKKILSEMGGNASIERYLFLREVYDTEIVEHRSASIAFLGGWGNRNLAIMKMHDLKQI